jgi:hypothetical protein
LKVAQLYGNRPATVSKPSSNCLETVRQRSLYFPYTFLILYINFLLILGQYYISILSIFLQYCYEMRN